jgi:hypothetical protein
LASFKRRLPGRSTKHAGSEPDPYASVRINCPDLPSDRRLEYFNAIVVDNYNRSTFSACYVRGDVPGDILGDRPGLFLVLAIQTDGVLDLVSVDNLKMKPRHLHTSSRGNVCRFRVFHVVACWLKSRMAVAVLAPEDQPAPPLDADVDACRPQRPAPPETRRRFEAGRWHRRDAGVTWRAAGTN